MKKTFVTTMPDHIGAFLKASERLASLGINITRVSYNKAVDSHTLFIDARGSADQLAEAARQLEEIGYLSNEKNGRSVVLLEFTLKDVPGSVTEVLRVIHRYHFNISYISSRENGTEVQYFQMGLFVEEGDRLSEFLEEVGKLCQVRVIDYNPSERVFDNGIFYRSFVNAIAARAQLDEGEKEELLVNANLAMQTLDEQGLSPFKTFDSIHRFAELLTKSRGEGFSPRVTRYAFTEKSSLTVIEPPCGSNTMLLQSDGETVMIDSGYAVYREEMLSLLKELFPSWEKGEKKIFLTHADVDHGGLLPLFDRILTGKKTADCLKNEFLGEDGFREQNPLHKPYIRMCKILTRYQSVDPQRVEGIWERSADAQELLAPAGEWRFGELCFQVYEGKGGHLPGELVLVERSHRLVFTGDVFINLHALTPEQAEYNRYAPILMTSVDTDPALCKAERGALVSLLGEGSWRIFGSHGGPKEIG